MDRELLGCLHPDDLEQVLAKLGDCHAALMGELVVVAQEVMARKLWRADGAAGPADWFAERLCLRRSDARQLCRVARALQDRPRLQAALADGALAWAKLVPLLELCRDTDAEGWWLDYAEGATVEHLEALARRQRDARRDRHTFADRRDRLRLVPRPDQGALQFWGTLFGDAAARFQTLIDHVARNETRPLPGEDPHPWDQRCADALSVLSSAALGGISRDRATINVHLNAEAAATNAATGQASMKPPYDSRYRRRSSNASPVTAAAAASTKPTANSPPGATPPAPHPPSNKPSCDATATASSKAAAPNTERSTTSTGAAAEDPPSSPTSSSSAGATTA